MSNGHDVSNSLKSNPEIANYLFLYQQCRMTQLFSLEKSKGSGRQATRVIKIVQMPTGYGVLPYAGGIMDQPYRMMTFFEIFFSEERRVAFQNLNS